MFAFLHSLFRRKPAPPPEPIEKGDVWELRAKNGDPFPQGPHAQVVVLDYMSGWVRYSAGVFKDCRLPETSFRYCYRKLPSVTTHISHC